MELEFISENLFHQTPAWRPGKKDSQNCFIGDIFPENLFLPVEMKSFLPGKKDQRTFDKDLPNKILFQFFLLPYLFGYLEIGKKKFFLDFFQYQGNLENRN